MCGADPPHHPLHLAGAPALLLPDPHLLLHGHAQGGEGLVLVGAPPGLQGPVQ